MSWTKEDLFALPRLRIREFDLFGKPCYARNMTTEERTAWEADQYVANGKNLVVNRMGLRARLISRSICKEDGTLLFTQADVETIKAMDGSITDPMYWESFQVNNLSQQDVDEMVKNLEAGRLVSSSSDSSVSGANQPAS